MVRSLFFFLRRGEKSIHSIFFLKLFKENNFYKWKLRWSILKSTRASLPNIVLCFGSATEETITDFQINQPVFCVF